MSKEVENLKNISREQELVFELTVASFERLPDAVVDTDMEGIIKLVNVRAEEMFGYHRTEMVGQNVGMLFPESARDAVAQYRKNFWSDPHPYWTGEGELVVNKDGDEFLVRIMLSPLISAQGRFLISIFRRI